jgi:ribulose-phosphate 3-epimerase
VIFAPSILNADFGHLADEVDKVARAGAGLIHVDVMDGHFVPNLTLGPAVVKAVRRATSLPIDVHLMVERAENHLDAFVDAGADWMSVHVEAQPHLDRTVARIRSLGKRVGVALNPATPASSLDAILSEVDFVLVMLVNPGFGGQPLIPRMLDKLRSLRQVLRERGLATLLEVDGGVAPENVRAVVSAGADVLVAGASVFAGGRPERALRLLVEAAQ